MASPTSSPELASDRAELLELICGDGILRSTPEQPIRSHDGTPIAWMLDSLRISLTPRGAALAARCLLAELAGFEATQLATYGLTAIPLVQACVALGGGRYTGIVVRKERKAYGSLKRIEGPIDRRRPVVVLDDSIASGTSMTSCLDVLEAEGLRVEGGVCLVRFAWAGGWARMLDRGLHMAAVFDVFRDLVPRVEPARPVPVANPSSALPDVRWADEPAPPGLHPAALARRVIECVHAARPVPRAPVRLDAEYDAAGGCWISVRSRANIHDRHARNGFWVFPGEPRPSAGEAVIRAALRTAGGVTPEQLATSAIAVTWFGPLEPCGVGQLDHERYGIVVRSRERIGRLGGALPRMPGIARDWAQFDHARTRNARLLPFEPFELFRHRVAKVVEPGVTWQPTGVPAGPPPSWHHAERAGRIAEHALALVRAVIAGAPAGEDAPAPAELAGSGDAFEAIYLTVFVDGRVVGCVGGRLGGTLGETLRQLARRIPDDPRFVRTAAAPDRLAVTVSFLDAPMVFGAQAPAAIATQLIPGRHALLVSQHQRTGLLLPLVTLQHSLTPAQFVAEVIDKAGITRPPYAWKRYDVRTWYADGTRTTHLPWGLPPGAPPPTIAAAIDHLLPRMLGYLGAHHRADGLRDGLYRPLLDRVLAELERPRQVHGAWTLAAAHRALGGDPLAGRGGDPLAGRDGDPLAGRARDALAAVVAALPEPAAGELVEAAFLLLAFAEADPHHALAAPLAARLIAAIDDHGLVAAPAPASPSGEDELEPAVRRERDRRRRASYLDYVLPQVVLALATALERGVIEADHREPARAAIARAFAMAGHRFRHGASWGQVGWLPQAALAVHRLAPERAAAELAFEVIDWALPYQQPGGGFVNGEQLDGPGCTTAVYLEGIAAALELARRVGDADRSERYRAAALAALRFVDELVYQERDRAMLPAPERAYGGLRLSRTAGDVRIDFVQHAIHALLCLRGDQASPATRSTE